MHYMGLILILNRIILLFLLNNNLNTNSNNIGENNMLFY